MRKSKNRYGCPNPECTSFKRQKKYKEDVDTCPECGYVLSHVCKSKGCYTVVEDNEEPFCLKCKAKREDKKDKKHKAVSIVGIGAAAATPAIVKNREVIKETIKNVIDLIKK